MNKNFYIYCYFGNVVGLNKLVKEADFDINERNSSGQTGLEIACGARRVDAVKFLLQNGADPTIKDDDGRCVMDNLDEYDARIQSLLRKKAQGELDEEIKRAKSLTDKEKLILAKINTSVKQGPDFEQTLTEKEIDEHNEKFERIVNSLAGKMTENEVFDFIVGKMAPCYFSLLVMRTDWKGKDAAVLEKWLDKKYYELKTYTELCDDMKNITLQLGVDDEHLDDLFDVVNIRTRLFYQTSDAQTINDMKLLVSKMVATEIAEMIAKGEIEEKPQRE